MIRAIACLGLLSAIGESAIAVDAFDRHTSFWLRQAVREKEPLKEVTSGQAAAWKALSPGSSPCAIVKTNNGHWTKALLSWGMRKSGGKLTPVLVIDRYVTYDNDRRDVALAAGSNVMLFPGYYFNFEIGQVVPEGHGGDVQFTDERKLLPAGNAQIFTLNGSALPPAGGDVKPDPNDHEGVLPRDFTGNWQVHSDGRWNGVWQLTTDDEGNVQGTYTSDESKSVYPLAGRVTGAPHRLTLDVELANTTQTFEAYLWTKDKSAMAGTTTLADRKFGFYATRRNEAQP